MWAPSQIPSIIIDESAPLQSSIGTEPSSGGERTSTDMRFLSESNLLMARIGHVSNRGLVLSFTVSTCVAEYFDEAPEGEAVFAASMFAVTVPSFNPFTTSLSSNSDGHEHDS